MKHYINITDEDGKIIDRFRIIDSTLSDVDGHGFPAIAAIEPGQEDSETETVPAPMAVESLVNRIQKVLLRDSDRLIASRDSNSARMRRQGLK